MNKKQGLFVLVSALLVCTMVPASEMHTLLKPFYAFKPLVVVQGGYAGFNAGDHVQSFVLDNADVFTYTPTSTGRNPGFVGAFFGAERALPWMTYPGFFMQTGVEYNYFGKAGVNGINTVGVEPETSTLYTYSYHLQTQQVLGTLRLFATTHERFHPYGEVGLGAAFNQSADFSANTAETGSINLTPGFINRNQTQFSYSLGLGLDTQVSTNVRVGLGYRYSNFGTSSFTEGVVNYYNYQSAALFALSGSEAYANQLIAGFTYLI